jgi:phosphopantetheine adenylyltransferase
MIKKNLTTYLTHGLTNSEIIKLTTDKAKKQYKKRKRNYFKYIKSNDPMVKRIYLTHTDKASSRYTPFDK